MPKVLIVDDTEETGKLLMRFLALHGYQSLATTDGEEALPTARAELPDVILMDEDLGTDVPGHEYTRRLKADEVTRGIPVVLITAFERDKAQMLAIGYDDYAKKPFFHDFPQLMKKIEALVHRAAPAAGN